MILAKHTRSYDSLVRSSVSHRVPDLLLTKTSYRQMSIDTNLKLKLIHGTSYLEKQFIYNGSNYYFTYTYAQKASGTIQ